MVKRIKIVADDRLRALVLDRLCARCGVVCDDSDPELTLSFEMDSSLPPQSFSIEPDGEKSIVIRGGDRLGLIYGAGRFLHTSRYTAEGFEPSALKGISVPNSSFRGIYFANHFFNWYHVAPIYDIYRYIEDLALWGYNTLFLVFPIINLNGWDDPETDKAFERIGLLFGAAKRIGMKTCIGVVANQDFKTPRPEFAAEKNRDPLGRHGNNGNNICVSRPGALAYLGDIFKEAARRLAPFGPDYVESWPYDEGGCGCDSCAPWGANGYLEATREMIARFRKQIPGIRLILSSWTFDTPPCGEWEGLYEALSKEPGFADYLVADSHEDFPRYPLEHPVPEGISLINFPEISMWGLFPWGGFGANPLPERLERLWSQVKHLVSGGYPYSEGLFDDINKAIIARFYWDAEARANDTLADYIAYEFGIADPKDCIELIRLIELNHTLYEKEKRVDAKAFKRAWELAKKIDRSLAAPWKTAWRWRILYLRSLLDYERYTRFIAGDIPGQGNDFWSSALENNSRAEEAFRELIALYRSFETDDGTYPEHAWIRPPLKN